MKQLSCYSVVGALLASLSLLPFVPAQAATTIAAGNAQAYGANLGWVNWCADTNNGAVIGEYVCSGYLYAANVGWISLGSGAPTNGIYYQNQAANDYGVNLDGWGNLRGCAWGANIGWVMFEPTGAPQVDLYTGNLSGSVWSVNCGWISLSNAVAQVQTTVIRPGGLAPNGLPSAWLLANFGTTNVNASADADGDGASNQQEYLAGTNPNDKNSNLRITSLQRGLAGDPARIDLQWTPNATRYYAVQQCSGLGGTNVWTDRFVCPWFNTSNVAFDDENPTRFYRLRAFRPLMP